MTHARKTARISDLSAPVATPTHQQAIDEAVKNPVSLTTDAVLSAASTATGLADFGKADFQPRLDTWLEVADQDDNLTALGRSLAFKRYVRYAVSRLRLNDLLHRHPEIHDIQISEPIIIVGPFRSGTTHLQGLLSADSRLRYLRAWERNEPIPHPPSDPQDNDEDPRITRYDAAWRWTTRALPHLQAMHSMAPPDPDEETDLQGPDFPLWLRKSTSLAPQPLELANHPEDAARHYSYMETVLKALQWQRGPARWVLKSTHHCEHLRALMATFPDATVVLTHRDPVAVVQSAATLASYMARLDYPAIDTAQMGWYWVQRVDEILHRMLEDQHIVSSERLVQIYFHDFMADQTGTVQRILRAAGLDLSSEQRARIARYQREQPRAKYGRVLYNLTDFALHPRKLRDRFKFYYDSAPVQPDFNSLYSP